MTDRLDRIEALLDRTAAENDRRFAPLEESDGKGDRVGGFFWRRCGRFQRVALKR